MLGILKEICTIFFAVLLLDEALTAADVGGFALCAIGVLIFALSKHEGFAAEVQERLPRWFSPWGRLDEAEAEETPESEAK